MPLGGGAARFPSTFDELEVSHQSTVAAGRVRNGRRKSKDPTHLISLTKAYFSVYRVCTWVCARITLFFFSLNFHHIFSSLDVACTQRDLTILRPPGEWIARAPCHFLDVAVV